MKLTFHGQIVEMGDLNEKTCGICVRTTTDQTFHFPVPHGDLPSVPLFAYVTISVDIPEKKS